MKKTAFLTGATGFVGANLARRLLSEGHAVHVLARPSADWWRLDEVRGGMEMHAGDLCDRESLARIFARVKPDWIFHCAAFGAYSWQKEMDRIIATNFLGTVNLVQAALEAGGFECCVHTGSSSEYGVKNFAPPETEFLEPNSHYAVGKAAATLFCRHTAAAAGARIPTLRLYSVYGAFEEPGRFIPTLALHALRGTLPPLVNPRVARDFIHVEDVIDACLRVASAGDALPEPGAVFNLGTGVQTTIADAVAVAREQFQIAQEPAWGSMQGRSWDAEVWQADIGRIRSALGWEPRIKFAEGFRQTAEWFRSRPDLHGRYRV